MHYYVYVLLCKDENFYIGFTRSIERRLVEHQNGKVFSTKGRLPITLIYYEAHLSKKDALRREKYLKTTSGRKALRLMLRTYLKRG